LLPSKQEHDCHEQLEQLTHPEHSFVDPGALQIGPPPVPLPVPVPVVVPAPDEPPAPVVAVVPLDPVVVPGSFAAWLQSEGGVQGVPQ
jgi:hypothetical protein